MSYCSIGNTPKVTYQFSGGQSVEYLSPVSPINITAGQGSYTNSTGYNPNGYEITFSSPSFGGGQGSFIVTSYTIVSINGTNYLNGTACNGHQILQNGDGSYNPGYIITSAVTVNNAVQCPVNSGSAGNCTIQISDSNGNTIFQAQGNCPVSFDVACSGRCPDGQCECHSDSYPGYCCQDCASTATQIQGMINQLKSKNAR